MKKGMAARVYSVNRARLKEALDSIDELVKPLRDALKCSRCRTVRDDDVDSNVCGSCADDLRAEEEARSNEVG